MSAFNQHSLQNLNFMNSHTEILEFDPETKKNLSFWLEGQYDEKTKALIRQMVQDDPKQVIDSFYTTLSFGTGGLRGLMGIGSNRMNVYTVRAATQGLVNYILKQTHQGCEPSVFIGYDSRHHSRIFAEETAKVCAGNGVRVYLFKDIRPTPLVSYGCRYKHCTAAVMITASHNPREYNGYKVYWSDGGQTVPPHDTGIMTEVNKIINPTMVHLAPNLDSPLIEEIDHEVDDAYIKDTSTLQCYSEENRRSGQQLKIVYTSLHGTGITIVPRALKAWGFSQLSYVDSQIIPDGDFPTVKSPNPEIPETMKMGIEKLLKSQADILIATDPDADRVGVAIRQGQEAILLSGNQIVSICLAHICEALTKQNRFPDRAAFVKSIVTTELFQAICDAYQHPCFNVLTGFKYIAEKIHEWEMLPNGYQYIFGGEESYGYLLGSFARDKDAVIASALICEVALQAKLQGKTLYDVLEDIYRRYGVYSEELIAINFGETKEGKEQMANSMSRLRASALQSINHIPVLAVDDYLLSIHSDLETGKISHLSLPKSDVLVYWLQDKSKVIIRPSGTEPKVKLYGGVVEKDFHNLEEGMKSCSQRCDALLQAVKGHLGS